MKSIILIIILLFAANYAVKAQGNSATAGVCLKIKYPDIELEDFSGDHYLTMYPGTSTEQLMFRWYFKGGKGLSYSIIGYWTTELGEYFLIYNEEKINFSENNFNGNTGISLPISYYFRINCKTGTPRGEYTGVYKVIVTYN